jgi:hypothetical protein
VCPTFFVAVLNTLLFFKQTFTSHKFRGKYRCNMAPGGDEDIWINIETLSLAEKQFQSNETLSKNIFGQMILRPNVFFQTNDKKIGQMTFRPKIFRSFNLSVKQLCGQMKFRSYDSFLNYFGKITFRWKNLSVKFLDKWLFDQMVFGQMAFGQKWTRTIYAFSLFQHKFINLKGFLKGFLLFFQVFCQNNFLNVFKMT